MKNYEPAKTMALFSFPYSAVALTRTFGLVDIKPGMEWVHLLDFSVYLVAFVALLWLLRIATNPDIEG